MFHLNSYDGFIYEESIESGGRYSPNSNRGIVGSFGRLLYFLVDFLSKYYLHCPASAKIDQVDHFISGVFWYVIEFIGYHLVGHPRKLMDRPIRFGDDFDT